MSDTDGNQPVEVDVNTPGDTDSLEAFEAVFYDRKPKAEPEAKEEVEEIEDPEVDDAEPEDEESEEEADDGDEDDDPKPEEQPKHKNRKSAKERINELVAERRAADERASAAERRVADLEARMAKLETPKEAPVEAPQADVSVVDDAPYPDAVDADGNPVYPLGEFDPQYIVDLTRYTFKKETEAREAEAKRADELSKAEATQAKIIETWEGKLTETETELPDLREKIAGLEESFAGIDPTYGTYLAETIMQMDRGPEVLYYLATNPSEAQQIVASGAVAATIALGRLEGRLPTKETEASNKKKVSKAPTPPVATRGTGVAVTTPPDTDDLEAFERIFYDKRKR